MSLINYLSAEWNKLKQHKWLLFSVIIVLFVPLVYAMIILSAKWGPYDNLDNVPVAVVNNDEGAISDGETIHVGDELISNLKANPTLDWDFVSEEEANNGMKNQKYYMTIEVPESFSSKVITVMDDQPETPTLKYTQNEGLHFMAAQVTEKAIETIQNQLSEQVTKTYVDNVFSQLDEVKDGFSDASDGSKQLKDGLGKLKDGSDEILGSLTEKSGDIHRLAEGAEELEAGAKKLNDSVVVKQPDIARLAEGSKTLNAGTNTLLTNLNEKSSDIARLAAGAKEVNDGTGLLLETIENKSSDITALATGASALSDGANQLQSGSKELLKGVKAANNGSEQLIKGLSEQLTPGSAALADGVAQAQAGVNETIESMKGLKSALEQLPNSEPGLENNKLFQIIMHTLTESLQDAPQKQADFQKLADGANAIKAALSKEGEFTQGIHSLDNGLNEIVNGQTKLDNGIQELSDGASQVATGNAQVEQGWKDLEVNVAKLHDGTTQIKDGNQSVKTGWNELQSGAAQLHDGSTQLSDGNQKVKAGWDELIAGSDALYDGSTQISDGNQTVETGWGLLTDGVEQVDDGLKEAKDGSVELASGLLEGKEKTGQIDPEEENKTMFAAPVQIDGDIIHSFDFYRDANAPYILTLALMAGVIALSFVMRFDKPVIMPANGFVWFTGKVSVVTSLTVIQSLLISLFALFFLKIEVHSNIAFILFSVWVSITFLMLIMFLVALAGNLGKFIALVFVILQLSTTGAALPIHMLPEGLRQLSVFLPFTYAIDGFKQIITLGSMSFVWKDVLVLGMFFIIALILTLTVFLMKHRYIENKEIDMDRESNHVVS